MCMWWGVARYVYLRGMLSVHATEELILYTEKMNIAPFNAPTNGHVVTW